MKININQLYTFYCVAKHKNMQDAAQELFISPPAVTMQIKRLENWFGFELFSRTKSGLKLTKKATEVFEQAQVFFEKASELESSLLNLKANSMQIFKIGIHRTPSEWLIPKIFKSFAKSNININIETINGMRDELFHKLEHNEIDIALLPELPKLNSKYKKEFFAEYSVLFVVNSNNPLAKKKNISIEELEDIPILLQAKGTPFTDHLQKYFSENNIQLKNIVENISSGIAKKIILEEEYAAFMPSFSVEDDIKHARFTELKIEKNLPKIKLYAFYNSQNQHKVLDDFLLALKNI